MIKQIKYFQAVVRCQSFTRAADDCFISQSAISQQIQALEKELGVQLIQRERRKISLTPAGEFFYKKSLVIINDFDRLCADTIKFSNGVEQELSIGYLRHYHGLELQKALQEFQIRRPEISITLLSGTHEELYDYLRTDKADIVISDLRRKPSDKYVNFFLAKGYLYAELPEKNSLTQLESLTMDDLKNTPIILIAPPSQQFVEETFFKEYFGVKSDFIFAETLEAAHLLVSANKGYFPMEFTFPPEISSNVKYLPLMREGKQLYKKHYAFWRADTLKSYIEEFAEILRPLFSEELESAVSEKNF